MLNSTSVNSCLTKLSEYTETNGLYASGVFKDLKWGAKRPCLLIIEMPIYPLLVKGKYLFSWLVSDCSFVFGDIVSSRHSDRAAFFKFNESLYFSKRDFAHVSNSSWKLKDYLFQKHAFLDVLKSINLTRVNSISSWFEATSIYKQY